MITKCVAIGRQYGSGGREVGKRLAGRLGVPFYDRELLELAAQRSGLHPGELRERDERRPDSLLYGISLLSDGARGYRQYEQPYRFYQAECDTIRLLASQGPCVFIGRCADVALQGVCGTLSVFIYASSLEDRVRRVREMDGVEAKNAGQVLKRKDAQRRGYYNLFAQREWGRMENYDMCLNTSTLGYDGCVRAIEQLVREE